MKELPPRITSFGQPDDYWPLDMGSWRWARGEQQARSAISIAEALKKLQTRLPEMTERIALVDGMIKASLSGDGASMRRGAMNARRDAGRSAQLAAARRPDRFYSENYADFVADKVAADSDLDCARSDLETDTLVDFFIRKGKLSAPAYNALRRLLRACRPISASVLAPKPSI